MRDRGWVWLGTGMGLCAWLTGGSVVAREPSAGTTVAVVYNTREEESRAVAVHYAERRGVPSNQLFGFDLPTEEVLSRSEFRKRLQEPLLKALDREGLLVLRSDIRPRASRRGVGSATMRVEAAKIRYLLLCYGVPTRIREDMRLKERGAKDVAESLRRNEAAVDSELAWLPQYYDEPMLTGPLANPGWGQTNMAALGPQSGLLMVTRLDGPNASVARGLVDKALAAERDGLWGRAYVDLRGVTNSGYAMGDRWLGNAARLLRDAGYGVTVDTNEVTFPAGFPMSDVAFYAGWYDGEVSGPFTWRVAQFMSGAFAYHLHSFSAERLRSTTRRWVGPLLARGASASVGYVAEPYLSGTLDVGAFVVRWVQGGFSYGEAVYAALPALSWQGTVVGDPLYRPFGRQPRSLPLGARFQELHVELSSRTNALLAWSHLQVVNLATKPTSGVGREELLKYIDRAVETTQSSVLSERQAELLLGAGRIEPAIKAYRQSLERGGSEGQRLRVMLNLAELQAVYKADKEALETYEQVLKVFPDYPDRGNVLNRAIKLARQLGLTEELQQLEKMRL